MTTLTLLTDATEAHGSPAFMQRIDGDITITVTGQPSGLSLVVSLFGAASFAEPPSPFALVVSEPGTYTLTAENAMGIRAALLEQPTSPVSVVVEF